MIYPGVGPIGAPASAPSGGAPVSGIDAEVASLESTLAFGSPQRFETLVSAGAFSTTLPTQAARIGFFVTSSYPSAICGAPAFHEFAPTGVAPGGCGWPIARARFAQSSTMRAATCQCPSARVRFAARSASVRTACGKPVML